MVSGVSFGMFFYAAGLLSRWRFEDGTEACVSTLPLSGAWLREACLRCWNATYSWRSLFETVLMALGFCSVVCVRAWKRRLCEESSCLSG
ncbi:hypothetical protein NPIL_42271 [Nephila pilipes]|uniref:Uncharacterized protein n=1 Tax=Nephila pilipes TaxID=299642 RepID=A0A8X6Q8B0_NEPPI|nr:hypothetical protein NPIL_42271 [Nephila pilipes]